MNQFDAEFERCSKWLQDALDHGGNTHDLHDLKSGILEGNFKFWPAPYGAVVTAFLEYPKIRVLNIWLGGGKIEQLLDMVPSLVQYAKENGCKSIMCCGRPGWERALKPYGFKAIMPVCSKEID